MDSGLGLSMEFVCQGGYVIMMERYGPLKPENGRKEQKQGTLMGVSGVTSRVLCYVLVSLAFVWFRILCPWYQ